MHQTINGHMRCPFLLSTHLPLRFILPTNSPLPLHPIPSKVNGCADHFSERLSQPLRQATSPTVLVTFTAVRSYLRLRWSAVSGMHVDLSHSSLPRKRMNGHIIQHGQKLLPVLLRVADGGDEFGVAQRVFLAEGFYALVEVCQRERLGFMGSNGSTVTNVSVFVPTSTTGFPSKSCW